MYFVFFERVYYNNGGYILFKNKVLKILDGIG